MIKKYLVTKDYESPYPEPLVFQKGENVAVGKDFTDDPDWGNWIWCKGEQAKAWVPKQFLEINGESGVFNRDYNALELNVAVGENCWFLKSSMASAWQKKQTSKKAGCQ